MSKQENREGIDFIRCRVCGKELRSLGLHLRRCHGMSSDEYKQAYGVDFVSCATHRQALSRRGTGYKVLSREQVAEKLRELSCKVSPITTDWLKNSEHQYLLNYVKSLFGGLPNALKELGLDVSRREASPRERIISELKELDAAGEDLNRKRIASRDRRLVGRAENHFGSWSKALAAAGVNPHDHHSALHKTTAEWEVEFRQWVEQHGPLSYAKLCSTGFGNLYCLAQARFGTLEEAAKAFGLPFKRRQALGRSAVVARLKARLLKGERINASTLQKEEPRLYTAINKHFGSHRECLIELGYDPNRIGQAAINWTRERVDRELLAWVGEHDAVVSTRLRKERPTLQRRACQFYGSVEAAAAALGLRYIGRRSKPNA